MRTLFFLFLLSPLLLFADVPVAHSGHVSVNGSPFNGTGKFKFSIVNQFGSVIWNHDGSVISTPTGELSLPVRNGFYSLHLGDSSIPGMSTLPATSLRSTEKAFLRVWFDEGDGSFEKIGGDIALGAAPFALVSELSRGSPEIESKIEQLEQLVASLTTQLDLLRTDLNTTIQANESKIMDNAAILAQIPASAIDPVLLAEVGYRKFSSRELIGLSLPGVDFSETDFENASIRSANLIDSSLANANLQGGIISDSNLSNANMGTANLSRVRLRQSRFDGMIANGASFNSAEVNGSIFTGASFVNADLSETDVKESDFSNASLQGSSLLNADLTGCIFISANLSSIDAQESNFSSTDLTDATLSGNLSGANFHTSTLTGADFSGSDLSDANLKDAIGFDPADHTNVIYSNTTLPDGTVRTD